MESKLSDSIPDVGFRKLTDVATGKNMATIIESSESPEVLKSAISTLGINLTEENSSTEFTGPSLSNQFYKQLMQYLENVQETFLIVRMKLQIYLLMI